MKHVLTLILLGVMAASVQASTVTFELLIDEDGPGTFNLYGSTVDSFGIASYGVPLTGGILSIDHNSPNGLSQLGLSGSVGFTVLRSADGVANLVAGQDTVTPTPHIVKGFGQSGGDLATAPGVSFLLISEQATYSAPLLLASGTYAGLQPGFNLLSVDLGANVFTDGGSTTTANEIADIATSVSVVPEPSSIILGACAGLALLAVSRRRIRDRRC